MSDGKLDEVLSGGCDARWGRSCSGKGFELLDFRKGAKQLIHCIGRAASLAEMRLTARE